MLARGWDGSDEDDDEAEEAIITKKPAGPIVK